MTRDSQPTVLATETVTPADDCFCEDDCVLTGVAHEKCIVDASPFCECDLEPVEDEDAANQCSCCGKPLR